MQNRPLIGVGVMIWKGNQVLLGKRINTDGEDNWQFPGGRLELGETVTECAAREVREETGLEVATLVHAGYTNSMHAAGDQHYITLYVMAEYLSGEPVVIETDKCRCWRWFRYDQLPSPLFEPITNLLAQIPDLGVLRAGRDTRANGRK